MFGPGQTETAVRQSDAWIWQMVCLKSKGFLEVLTTNYGLKNAASCFTQEGSSTVEMNQQEFNLNAGESVLIPEQTQ